MRSNITKLLQRRLYTFVNTCWGFSFIVFLAYLVLLPIFKLSLFSEVDPCSARGNKAFCSSTNFKDNIGNVDGAEYIAHGSIDVVYTWVNGSDPVWKAKKEFWAQRLAESHQHRNHGEESQGNEEQQFNSSVSATIYSNITGISVSVNQTEFISVNITMDSTNSTAINSTVSENPEFVLDDEDAETMTANRYRDSEELRYSLRSLVKNAPWIRHIYLVTDNQIPYWLNMESSKLTVLSHEDVFTNKSHLPVFSSPAIEANLHNIPGISKKFIYFNDDVFLGSPTLPDDFVTLTGAQKFVMAWDVPKCAPGCSDSWIGDGYCDKACNVSACNWDFPDCVNGSNINPTGVNGGYDNIQTMNIYCTKYCPDTWLADKICDQRCKIPECGWDIGDCGLDLVLDGYHGITLDDASADIPHKHTTNDNTADTTNITNGMPHSTPDVDSGTGSVRYYGENSGQGRQHQYGSDDNLARERSYYYGHGAPINEAEEGTAFNFQHTPALVVPYGTFAVYFNLSMLPCYAWSLNRSTEETCYAQNLSSSFVYSSNSHDDYSKYVIHQSILLDKHDLLVVTLYHGQEDAPRPYYFPYTVTFTVEGSFPGQDAVKMSFSLQIINPDEVAKLSDYVPNRMALVESPIGDRIHAYGFPKESSPKSLLSTSLASFNHTAEAVAQEAHKQDSCVSEQVELVQLPVRQSRKNGGGYTCDELASAAELENSAVRRQERFVYLVHSNYIHRLLRVVTNSQVTTTTSTTSISDILSQVIVATTFTLRNDTQYHHEETLLDSLVEYTRNKVNFQPKEFSPFNESSIEQQENMLADRLWTLLRGDYRDFLESALARLLYDSPAQRRVLRDRLQSVQHLPRSTDSTLLTTANEEQELLQQQGGGILLSVPLPEPWVNLPLSWIHVKVEVGLRPLSPTTPPSGCWHKQHVQHNSSDAIEATAEASLTTRRPALFAAHLKQYIAWTNLLQWGRNMSAPLSVAAAEDDESSIAIDNANQPLLSETLSAENIVVPSETISETQPAANETVVLEESTIIRSQENTAASEPIETEVTSLRDHNHRRRRRLAAHRQQGHSASPKIEVSDIPSTFTVMLQLPHLLWSKFVHPLWLFYTAPLIDMADYFASATLQYAEFLNQPEDLTGRKLHDAHQRRRLLDTYAQSLIHVNRLYNKAFGNDNRKVPAHVPHMIDRDYMVEMQTKWSAEWNATSSHRFRAVDDMQFAFAYYYYVMNRRKIQPPDYLNYLAQVVDTNNDKFIDPNEWHTLLNVVLGSRFTDDDDLRMSHCVRFPLLYAANASNNMSNNETSSASYRDANISFLHPLKYSAHADETIEHRHKHGKVVKTVSYLAYPRLSELIQCPLLIDALKTKVDWQIRQPTHFTESDKDLVAFEMIGDNMTDSLNQLNSIRQRQSKFICVNDNMQNPPAELTHALRAFFEALYPTPSEFELPPQQRNPTLYIHEYRALQNVRSLQRSSVLFHLSQFFSLVWLRDIYQTIHLSLQKSALSWAQYILDTSVADAETAGHVNQDVLALKRIQQRLRQDVRRDPLVHLSTDHVKKATIETKNAKMDPLPAFSSRPKPANLHSAATAAAVRTNEVVTMFDVHVVAWMMVAGLVLVLLVRMLVAKSAKKRAHAPTNVVSSSANNITATGTTTGTTTVSNTQKVKKVEDRKKKDDDYHAANNTDASQLASTSSVTNTTKKAWVREEEDDEEGPMLQRLRDIERRLYQSEDEEENEEQMDAQIAQNLQQRQPFTTLPLTTPLYDTIRTHLPFVGSHDQMLGYRPTIPAPRMLTTAPPSIAAAYPKQFQRIARPSTEEEEEAVVVDDRIYTAQDHSYLRKYSSAMLEDAAGIGPGTSALQFEIFTDGVMGQNNTSRSRANSESLTAATFPGHK